MTKMTYAMALEVAINTVSDGEVKDKLTALKAQIEKKNSAERKPTKTQVANDNLRGEIVSLLTDAENMMTASDIANHFGVSNQKITALMGKLLEDGAVVREVIKRKAYCGGSNPPPPTLLTNSHFCFPPFLGRLHHFTVVKRRPGKNPKIFT